MKKFFTTDWVEYFFKKVSLLMYESEQERHRKIRRSEKNKIVKNNRIIVKVNDDIIYDSKKQKDMSDDLFYALLSYGLKESIRSNERNKKAPINYNLFPSISSITALPSAEIKENSV